MRVNDKWVFVPSLKKYGEKDNAKLLKTVNAYITKQGGQYPFSGIVRLSNLSFRFYCRFFRQKLSIINYRALTDINYFLK